MQILFADESGTPPKSDKLTPRYFVIGGVIIPENTWHRLRDAVLGMKKRRKIRGEFKWRYFAPGNDDAANPMRHLAAAARNEIRGELYGIIKAERSVRTMAAICSAATAYKMQSVTNQDGIYHLTYKVITERFQYYLGDISSERGEVERGIIVADPRGGDSDKRLRAHHQKLLYADGRFISKYNNLVEGLFLQPSHVSIGIQLADMVAGAVWRKYERSDDHWFKQIRATLRHGPDGQLEGYGLVKVPKLGWV